MQLIFPIVLVQFCNVLYGHPVTKESLASNALRDPHLFDGDIVLKNKENFNAVTEDDLLWPHGRVHYEIDKALHHIKPLIEQAIGHIEQNTCIKFHPRTYGHNENYVHITPGPGANCSSKVGLAGGKQDLTLGYNCRYLGTILHELMHVIGFYHEHSRSDRDEFIAVHYENIIPGMEYNFVKLNANQIRLLEPFDYHSITIYGEFGFSKNGQPTMLPRQHGELITDPNYKSSLSHLDIKAVNKLYKC